MSRHPFWCSPAHCNVLPGSPGGSHESRHRLIEGGLATDAFVRVLLYRPGQPADVGTRLVLEIDGADGQPGAVVVLTPRRVLRLIGALSDLLTGSVTDPP
jgi:hypothetical protein